MYDFLFNSVGIKLIKFNLTVFNFNITLRVLAHKKANLNLYNIN